MNMPDCPKFSACSAPLCPLDKDFRLRAHNPEDRVCFYLCESVKPGAEGRLDLAMLEACRAMTASGELGCEVRIRLKSAATSGSRIDSAKALRGRRSGAAGIPATVYNAVAG